MRMVSLASGSSGNCVYIGSENHHILIDAGITRKRMEEELTSLQIKPEELSAILVTHEHTDHIGGLGVMSRKYGIPIYATAGTTQQIGQAKALGKIPGELFHRVLAEEDFKIGDLTIKPFAVSHDAAEPVAYRVEQGAHSVAVVTDLGEYTPDTVKKMENLDAILLEANHDVRMLQAGPYPYRLKQRILGSKGHLSNETAGRLLCDVLHGGLQAVLLGHLSKENNYAALAYETVRLEVTLGEGNHRGDEIDLKVAPRAELSGIIEV